MRRRQAAFAPVPRDTMTEWWWSPPPTIYRTMPAGFSGFEHVVLPEIDPGPGARFVFAHEFKLVAGDVGTMGLVTGSDVDAAPPKLAVFSIRNAVSAESGSGGSAVPDVAGWTCSLPYPWENAHPYGMRVWTDEQGWWSAAVRDQATGTELVIGRIRVPGDWRRLAGWSVSATRYQGRPLALCDHLPQCQVAYREPTADGGKVRPLRHENHLGEGTCETSRIADVRDGVRHGMGSAG